MADISSSVRQGIRVGPRSLVIAVSQSGQTPDVVALAQASAAAGSTVITVSNEPGTLAGTGSLHLPLHAGPERAIPATKTVAAQLAMLATVASAYTTRQAPSTDTVRAVTQIMAHTLQERQDTLVDSLVSAPPLVAVGSGAGLGLAGEFVQKLQETCALRIMALDAAEFIHGPRAMLTASDSVVAFDVGNPDVIDQMQAAIADVGASLVRLGEPHPLLGREHVGPGMIQALDCLPALMQIQVIMVAMARKLGFDPDRAFGQSKITHTV
jgi:glucosamine--fructose-6-phosphate aminotransferase (isomerizing)